MHYWREHKILQSGTEVDRTIDGNEAAILTKKLRNAYAHSLGRPDPKNPDHKALFRRLNKYLGLNENIDNAEHFPNSIDTVLFPLFKGCKEYAEGVLNKSPSLGKSSKNHVILYDIDITFSSGSIQII